MTHNRPRAIRRALPLWLALVAAYALTLGLDQTPGERFTDAEARILLTAESIVSDGDLDVRDDYLLRSYSGWYGEELEPAGALTDGRLHEPHGLGLPLLIAPAYALAGPTGVELFLAALLAAAFCVAAALGRLLVPEPWATRAALVMGLSPPALGAATTVSAEGAGALLIAGAALLAFRVRERPRLRWVFWCAALAAAAPWLALKLFAPAAVIALAMWRWLRRRNRGLAGFVAIEVVLLSAVFYVSVNQRLYGGITPYDAAYPGSPASATGAGDIGEALERWPRLLGVWLDPAAGLLLWAPFVALALASLWMLWHSRRERLAIAVDDQVDVEVSAGLLWLACAAVLAVAIFAAPDLLGRWFPGHEVVPALPLLAALCAWALRRFPRSGFGLGAATVAVSVWLLVAARVGDGAALAPPEGPLPWGFL